MSDHSDTSEFDLSECEVEELEINTGDETGKYYYKLQTLLNLDKLDVSGLILPLVARF